ncbi:hypothetical protein HOG98_01465 [bacterium]|jgi:hypothetical protein|nr:hypothetical protein [bacterium]
MNKVVAVPILTQSVQSPGLEDSILIHSVESVIPELYKLKEDIIKSLSDLVDNFLGIRAIKQQDYYDGKLELTRIPGVPVDVSVLVEWAVEGIKLEETQLIGNIVLETIRKLTTLSDMCAADSESSISEILNVYIEDIGDGDRIKELLKREFKDFTFPTVAGGYVPAEERGGSIGFGNVYYQGAVQQLIANRQSNRVNSSTRPGILCRQSRINAGRSGGRRSSMANPLSEPRPQTRYQRGFSAAIAQPSPDDSSDSDTDVEEPVGTILPANSASLSRLGLENEEESMSMHSQKDSYDASDDSDVSTDYTNNFLDLSNYDKIKIDDGVGDKVNVINNNVLGVNVDGINPITKFLSKQVNTIEAVEAGFRYKLTPSEMSKPNFSKFTPLDARSIRTTNVDEELIRPTSFLTFIRAIVDLVPSPKVDVVKLAFRLGNVKHELTLSEHDIPVEFSDDISGQLMAMPIRLTCSSHRQSSSKDAYSNGEESLSKKAKVEQSQKVSGDVEPICDTSYLVDEKTKESLPFCTCGCGFDVENDDETKLKIEQWLKETVKKSTCLGRLDSES